MYKSCYIFLYDDRKKDDRLDWMYQGPAGQVSRDEYLLGRPIDKQITDQYEEPESGPSAETGLLPGSIFNPATPASNLDLAAKIREDPLFEIRLVLCILYWNYVSLWKISLYFVCVLKETWGRKEEGSLD